MYYLVVHSKIRLTLRIIDLILTYSKLIPWIHILSLPHWTAFMGFPSDSFMAAHRSELSLYYPLNEASSPACWKWSPFGLGSPSECPRTYFERLAASLCFCQFLSACLSLGLPVYCLDVYLCLFTHYGGLSVSFTVFVFLSTPLCLCGANHTSVPVLFWMMFFHTTYISNDYWNFEISLRNANQWETP